MLLRGSGFAEWDLDELNLRSASDHSDRPITAEKMSKDIIRKRAQAYLKEEAVKLYEAKEAEFPEPEHIREIERVVLLK